MQFEYDLLKSETNKIKHGIDFNEAQKLWNDPFRLEIEAKSDSESRFIIIGKIKDKHWSAIITYRNNAIRIISVRRAKKKEIKSYES
jgi:uncharacterized DUF497 family protein